MFILVLIGILLDKADALFPKVFAQVLCSILLFLMRSLFFFPPISFIPFVNPQAMCLETSLGL